MLRPPSHSVIYPLEASDPPLSWRKPRALLETLVPWLLAAFAFVLATDLRLPDGRSIAMRLGYLCLILGIAGMLQRRWAVRPPQGFWVLLGFVVWSTCTLGWAQFPEQARHKVVLYWALFAVSAILPQCAWHPDVRLRLLKAYVAGCWLGVLGIVMNFARGIPFRAEGEDELQGRYSFGTDPNYLGLALVVGIPLAIYAANATTARWQKAALRLYLPAAVMGVLLTGSRGASIALFAVAVLYALRASRRVWLLLLGGTVLCVTLLATFPTAISDRFITMPEALRYGSLSDRRELWDSGAMVVRDNLLQGVGAGASAGILSIAVHNTPLELTMEGGLVSLCLFYGAFLLGLGRTLEQDRRAGWSMVGACAAWLIGCMALSWEIETVSWFLAMILNSWAPLRLVAERTETAAPALRATA